MREPTQLADDVGDAISAVLADESEFVTKWVAVVEVIDKDGHRWLRAFYPSDGAAWDSIGMLRAAESDMASGIWTHP